MRNSAWGAWVNRSAAVGSRVTCAGGLALLFSSSALGNTLPIVGVDAGRVAVEAAAFAEVALTYDVVVVGAGAAGYSAALGARREDPDAEIVILEARETHGGTTIRSGGRLWIPNNSDMATFGLEDPRREAIAYMARLAYPDAYHPHRVRFGLTRRKYDLIATYYDQGAAILDHYRDEGILPWTAEQMEYFPWCHDPLGLTGTLASDYRPELPEDVPKRGRSIVPDRYPPNESGQSNYGATLAGVDLISWMHDAAVRTGTEVHYETWVHDLVTTRDPDSGALVVEGVRARVRVEDATAPSDVVYRARKGVVFASGGFSKNAERMEENFVGDHALTGGGCAVTTARGELVGIADRYGFQLENMDQAWFIQNVYEQYKKDPDSRLGPNYLVFQAYWPNGDSSFMVNRKGVRVVNEKMNYNDRTQVHFEPDNRFLLGIFDEHTIRYYAGFAGHVTPAVDTFIGPANDLESLRDQIALRLLRDPDTASYLLTDDFAEALGTTLDRFGGFARTGVDLDFHRGETDVELWWHSYCLFYQCANEESAALGQRDCITANVDENDTRYPNPMLRPLAPPYYAVILSSGLQDTKGGPAIDPNAQILTAEGEPVPGLFGAGNAIASPAGAGYWGGGGTLGPAVVFGHIAGRSAARGLGR